jgi:hypothetical protein
MADEVMLPNGKVDYNVCKHCGMARKPCAYGQGVFLTNTWYDIVHDEIVLGRIYIWIKPGYTNILTVVSQEQDLEIKVPLEVFHIQSIETERHSSPLLGDPFILKSEYEERNIAACKAWQDRRINSE